MNILNNKTTGQVISIDKISENNIYYTIYENTWFQSKKLFGIEKSTGKGIDNTIRVNKTVFPDLTISGDEYRNYVAMLQVVAIETGFTIETDVQNWYILIGSTNLPTTVRVFIPNKAYDLALGDRDNEEGTYYLLWQVISGVQSTLPTNTAQITYNCLCQYLEEIYPQSKEVLDYYIATYPELNILIEYKN